MLAWKSTESGPWMHYIDIVEITGMSVLNFILSFFIISKSLKVRLRVERFSGKVDISAVACRQPCQNPSLLCF